MTDHLTVQILAAVVVLTGAATDVHSRRIPNWLTLTGVCIGLLVNWSIAGLAGLGYSIAGMLLGFGAYLLLYMLRAMGAGDVKLMAAVGALVGPDRWIFVFLASALAGGILALALTIWKGRMRETLWNSLFIVQELARFRAPYKRKAQLDIKDPRALNMPHGVAIAAGTLSCLFLAVI